MTVSDPGFYLLMIFPLFSFFLCLRFQHSMEKKTDLLKGWSKETKFKNSRKKNGFHLFYRQGTEVQRDWTMLPAFHGDLR